MAVEPSPKDHVARGREVLDIEIEGLQAVRDQLGEGFSKAVEMLAACSGRVVVTGIGKSGLVGRKIAATMSSTGTPSFFLHPVEGAHGDMGMIQPADVTLAISNSGETDELNAILPVIRTLGAGIVAMTGDVSSTLARMADAVIEVRTPREACPMGMAPTASTTATLAVGDALAVRLMDLHSFKSSDFRRFHPGGVLGGRLALLVDELMHSEDLPTVSEDALLEDALRVLDERRLGLAVVTDGAGRLVGVVTDGDVRRLVRRGGLDPRACVSEMMTRNPRKATSGAKAALALDTMENHQVTVLPVVGPEDKLMGVVHMHDLLGKGRVKFG
ncbi:MAG: SIS domain-containing protein [Desulfovibrionaceae bacterium]